MGPFYVLIGLSGLVLLAMLLSLARALGWRRPRPYVLPAPLLRGSEGSLLAVLEHILGPDYRILVRVRAADVLEPSPRLGRRERERAADRLEGYRFDFLVCERETASACFAVVLVPRPRLRRTPRATGLDRICRMVGLPLVRLIESPHYAIAEVEARIREARSDSARRPGAVPRLGPDLTKSLRLDDEPRFTIDLDLDES